MTFRVTLLLAVQQRQASLQRAPVAGVLYLLALSKSSLNVVLGCRCRLVFGAKLLQGFASFMKARCIQNRFKAISIIEL